MASKPGSNADGKDVGSKSAGKGGGDRLPFEPTSSRKKSARSAAKSSPAPSSSGSSPAPKPAKKVAKASVPPKNSKVGAKSASSSSKRSPASRQENAIPEVVSKRMIKRMALLSGIPTVLGLSTFVVSYFIVIKGGITLPPIAVLLVSLGFFGLGVLGISYGALSTSWEIDQEGGSLLGWDEFTTNLGRLRQAWRESRGN